MIPSIILANSWPGWKHCKPWLNDPALVHTKCWSAKPGSLGRRPSKSPISSSLSRSRVTSRVACNADKRRVRSRDHVILVCLMLSQISYAPTWFMVSNEAWHGVGTDNHNKSHYLVLMIPFNIHFSFLPPFALISASNPHLGWRNSFTKLLLINGQAADICSWHVECKGQTTVLSRTIDL